MSGHRQTRVVIGGREEPLEFVQALFDSEPNGREFVPVVKWWREGEWFCASTEGGEVFRSRHGCSRAVSYALRDFAVRLADLEAA